MTNVQERAFGANAAAIGNAPRELFGQAALGTPARSLMRGADLIRRAGPPYRLPVGLPPAIPGDLPGMSGIVSQLLGIIQQLMSMLGLGGLANGLGGGQGPEQFFQNANASSTGDPHLNFNGNRFDSMNSHSDLLDSDSFVGGYQLSTAVTQPDANGVTYNQQAAVSTDFGRTQVSLDKNGLASITQDGQTFSLANGQSIRLGDGETVTRNADGSLAVTDDDGVGGSITTTLSENGNGVDVNTQASNVDLGGDLVDAQPLPVSRPIMQPMWSSIAPPGAGPYFE